MRGVADDPLSLVIPSSTVRAASANVAPTTLMWIKEPGRLVEAGQRRRDLAALRNVR
jgi:hypothetical protein